MNKEVDFEVSDNATKAQIRSAFKKSLNKSKFNRKILSEFVELVA
jgi:ribosomal protein L23